MVIVFCLALPARQMVSKKIQQHVLSLWAESCVNYAGAFAPFDWWACLSPKFNITEAVLVLKSCGWREGLDCYYIELKNRISLGMFGRPSWVKYMRHRFSVGEYSQVVKLSNNKFAFLGLELNQTEAHLFEGEA